MSVVHTAAVARRIPKGHEHDFEEWLAKVVGTLHTVSGYEGMNIVTSPDARGTVKTMLIRFESAEALSNWESSPERGTLASHADNFSTHEYQTAPGLETFFAVPGGIGAPGPPRWKMCALTIPTAYVLVNAVLYLLPVLIPGMTRWPAAVRLLPVIAIMTMLLIYVCLPALSKIFAPWLSSRPARDRKQISQKRISCVQSLSNHLNRLRKS
jgi:uncharacterized protein